MKIKKGDNSYIVDYKTKNSTHLTFIGLEKYGHDYKENCEVEEEINKIKNEHEK